MNAQAFGDYAILVYLAVAIGALWLSISLIVAQFRTAKATERSAELLARIAKKLDPQAEAEAPPLRNRNVRETDLRNEAEMRAWLDGRFKTTAELAAYRQKNPISGM